MTRWFNSSKQIKGVGELRLTRVGNMSFFDAYGPFEIVREGGTVTGRQANFWEDVDYVELERAIGCYIFAIRHGQKIRPWYVGKTHAKTGFRGEVFQPHKLAISNTCLNDVRDVPVLFFFPLVTDGSTTESYRLSRAGKVKGREIKLLENQLMGFAHRRNPMISNVHEMSFLRNVEVLGLIGRRPGRPYREVEAVRRMLIG